MEVCARTGPGSVGDRGEEEILDAVLRCKGCGRRYPVVDGIPILLRDAASLLAGELLGLLAAPISPEVLGLLAAPGPDDGLLPFQLESLGAYLDAGWGDCAAPAADGPGAGHGARPLIDRLEARASARVDRALELGCSVGRGLHALSGGAELVVGVDRNPAALRYARRILRGEAVDWPRRAIGRTYQRARIQAPPPSCRVELLCGDVLEPPLAPATFGRVAALNLLDAVRRPRELLQQAHLLTAPGGELIFCTPYAWRSGVTDEGERLGGPAPEQALREQARELGWRIEEEAERLSWTLRRDARAASLYEVHWLRARRP